MSLDRRTVDQQLRRRTSGRGQGVEDRLPNALLGPADKAVVERLARTIDRRRIDPSAAGLKDMDDPADDAAVIDPRFATRVGRKIRLKPRELPLVQPEIALFHHRSPFGDLESRNAKFTKTFYGSEP